jgi:hypothetical protein
MTASQEAGLYLQGAHRCRRRHPGSDASGSSSTRSELFSNWRSQSVTSNLTAPKSRAQVRDHLPQHLSPMPHGHIHLAGDYHLAREHASRQGRVPARETLIFTVTDFVARVGASWAFKARRGGRQRTVTLRTQRHIFVTLHLIPYGCGLADRTRHECQSKSTRSRPQRPLLVRGNTDPRELTRNGRSS